MFLRVHVLRDVCRYRLGKRLPELRWRFCSQTRSGRRRTGKATISSARTRRARRSGTGRLIRQPMSCSRPQSRPYRLRNASARKWHRVQQRLSGRDGAISPHAEHPPGLVVDIRLAPRRLGGTSTLGHAAFDSDKVARRVIHIVRISRTPWWCVSSILRFTPRNLAPLRIPQGHPSSGYGKSGIEKNLCVEILIFRRRDEVHK